MIVARKVTAPTTSYRTCAADGCANEIWDSNKSGLCQEHITSRDAQIALVSVPKAPWEEA